MRVRWALALMLAAGTGAACRSGESSQGGAECGPGTSNVDGVCLPTDSLGGARGSAGRAGTTRTLGDGGSGGARSTTSAGYSGHGASMRGGAAAAGIRIRGTSGTDVTDTGGASTVRTNPGGSATTGGASTGGTSSGGRMAAGSPAQGAAAGNDGGGQAYVTTGGAPPVRGPLHAVQGEPCDVYGETACPYYDATYFLECSSLGWMPGFDCDGVLLGVDVCDSASGQCAPYHPRCDHEGVSPGGRYCYDNKVYECNLDGTEAEVVEECPVFCGTGMCRDDGDPCPPPELLGDDCSEDCPGGGECGPTDVYSLRCDGAWPLYLETPGDVSYVRTRYGWGDHKFGRICGCRDGSGNWMHLYASALSGAVRVSVEEPWWLSVRPDDVADCSAERHQCMVVPYDAPIILTTDDPNAPARNVRVELVEPGATCP